MKWLRVLTILCLTFQFAVSSFGADFKLSGPRGETQDEIIAKYEEMDADEQCADTVTGQFWYKIRVPIIETTKKMVEKKVWQTCWVYDAELCSNVLKRELVTIMEEVDVETTSYREELKCVSIKVPLDIVDNSPECDCDDVPVPVKGAGNAGLNSPANASIVNPEGNGVRLARVVKSDEQPGSRIDVVRPEANSAPQRSAATTPRMSSSERPRLVYSSVFLRQR